MIDSGAARVTIILPTFNRASFLPQAVEAIRAQTFADWDLVIVDDGSTDDTPAVLERLVPGFERPVQVIRQANLGAYGARNTGLDHARGQSIAFFDSDDLWLPHHLADCVAALDAHPDVDWVFSACRRIEHGSGRLLLENTFYRDDGSPWGFLKLRARVDGRLRIVDDHRAVVCHLEAEFNCGLQVSVIRRRVFEGYRFDASYRNESEDQIAVIRALACGFRLAYYDAVNVIYQLHSENSSASSGRGSLHKKLRVFLAEARGFEALEGQVALSLSERSALRRRLLEQYFWQIGYALLWQNGFRHDALQMFRKGLAHWPWSPACWKTYLLAWLRTRGVSAAGSPQSSSLTPGVPQ